MAKLMPIFLLLILSTDSRVVSEMGKNVGNPYAACGPSIILEKQQYAYGPPNTPDVPISQDEYNHRLSEFDVSKEHSDKLFVLAYIALQLGDHKNAEKYFKLAEQKDNFTQPSYYKTSLNYWLGQVYERSGNLRIAKEYYLKHGDIYFLHLIDAKLFESQGDLKSAEHQYLLAQSVALYEMLNYDPYKDLAEMFLKHGDPAKAKKYILKYVSCAEAELDHGGGGYSPTGKEHIVKARKLLRDIEEKLEKKR